MRDDIAEKLADKSEAGLIPRFIKAVNGESSENTLDNQNDVEYNEDDSQYAYNPRQKENLYKRVTPYYTDGIPFLYKNFPPENEVYSEAHRLAVWWARRDDIESGDQTIISMRGRYYLVEKFDDALNHYRVVSGVYTKDVNRIAKEIKDRGNSGRIKSIQRVDAGYDMRNSTSVSDAHGGSSADSFVSGHGRQDTQVENLVASSHFGGERIGRDDNTDNPSGGKDRAGENVDNTQASYTPPKSETFQELLSQHKSGLITDEEFEEMLLGKKPYTDPLSLINTKPEDFSTTPDINKKTGTFDGDGTRDTIIAKGRSTIFNTAFKNDVSSDDYIQKYMTSPTRRP